MRGVCGCWVCREGNGWSHQYCRRQWSLVDSEHLRYKYMNAWDAAMQHLDRECGFLSSQHLLVSCSNDKEQVPASFASWKGISA